MAQLPGPEEDRWLTIGAIGNVVVIVAHTLATTATRNRHRGGAYHQRPESHGA